MKKLFLLYILFFSTFFSAQTDYSNSWEDFYSYNNVKDFIKVDEVIYALADNAVFTYNVASGEINKLSSVQGLSGETTTSIHYSAAFKRLVIGYENGLIEVVDEDGFITISSDIVNFTQSGEKSINHIKESNNKLYLSTPFGIVVYDIDKLEFGDTFFIGNGSSSVKINQIEVFNGQIYAATETGIFSADITSNLLIDFNNWTQNFSGRNFTKIALFNNQIYCTEGNALHSFDGVTLSSIRSFSQQILAIKSSPSNLSITLKTSAIVLDASMNQVYQLLPNADFNFTLNNSYFENNSVFLASNEFGILNTTSSQLTSYTEIHPEGPLSNDVFSLASSNNNLWVVYGGYDDVYTPINNKKGFSHFNGENWINTKYNPALPFSDLNHVSIDPNAENRVFISSFGDTRSVNSVATGGLLVVENDEIKTFYNHLNSPLEDIVATIADRVTIRVSSSAFDSQGNLWIANIGLENELKKLSSSGQWSSFDMRSVETNVAFGLSEVAIDRNNSVWYGSRGNGVYVFNENGNRKKALIATPNLGNLPDLNVRTVAIDANNRVWLGTKSGLVVYANASGVFDDSTPNANNVVINGNDEGFGERLLGDQTVNSIVIDGAENKWFGTDNGGVIYTNPNGQTTLANFSKQNSPLPSNKIIKIAVDKSTGKVFFATNKGIVAYNSKVAPFGDVLGDVYAYPNPALKNHETVTIDGRNGTHLPKGTNVKIIDVAGNLVYETNVVEGQELQGGKVVWNKKNLAGTKVASGVYIVLLSNDDATETAVTKIAIVN
ncbi:two-component regulator propeller domain-containing protein [uncultured Polaribacter sp.]|uniref:type IX secretion system anionic LPS delivery protein PorZ n=1 Tax=uncultured Polaribacter sp. TaxID=174711 RepID=UPI002635C022|nr:two-component regulator propeller domain-containing protein [uncultured Polaribacter sp.]